MLDHQHLIVRAYVTKPPKSPAQGELWLRQLVKLVDMKELVAPKAIYSEEPGNEGLTGFVVLTTSHASFHSFEAGEAEPALFQMDLYSCRAFDHLAVIDHLNQAFEIVGSPGWQMVDRNP